MPRVRYTADGGRYRVASHTFKPGDEADVSDGLAEHLVENHGVFEYVDAYEDASEADTDAAPADGDANAASDEDADDAAGADAEPASAGEESEDASEADGDTAEGDGAALAVDPSEHTISELEDELDAVEDPAALEAIREAETDGKNRTGALDAIGSRLAEVDES